MPDTRTTAAGRSYPHAPSLTSEQADLRRRAVTAHRSLLRAKPHWVVSAGERPGRFKAALWLASPRIRRTSLELYADSLEHLRRILPPGLTCTPRDAQDAPAIVEAWF